jgi:hypothetical protein
VLFIMRSVRNIMHSRSLSDSARPTGRTFLPGGKIKKPVASFAIQNRL